MAPDPWLSIYDDTYHLAQEIAEKVHERERYLRNGENPARVNVTIRTMMKKLNERIAQLRDSLLRSVSTRQMYPSRSSAILLCLKWLVLLF
ncbi:unnamed protein product [Staurois parvus]|uniref:Syntaxin N-terminal domain-containing protein n=1 Tax=Staurois parvus TaxID=386267 RepID=A0ABN9F8U7_9NEOB|nr:unnamed protein product [Staurois parvus]